MQMRVRHDLYAESVPPNSLGFAAQPRTPGRQANEFLRHRRYTQRAAKYHLILAIEHRSVEIMPQSLSQVYLHIIFSTKGRLPFLNDAKLRADLHGYMQGICKNQECPSLRIGGVEDHAHVLCCLGRSISIADLVRELKRDSSKWIKEQCPELQ